MADDNEQEALAAMLASDGWRLFVEHVEAEWGAVAYAQKIDSTIAAAKSSREPVESDLCELGAAARAVKLAAQWPVQRVHDLRTKKPQPARMPFLRRGQ